MQPHHFRSLLLLAGATLASGCSTSPPEKSPFLLHVETRDQYGTPYDSVVVLATVRRDSAYTVLPPATTNALGEAILSEDPAGGEGAPDTILVVAYGDICVGHPGVSTIIAPDPASTSATVLLSLNRLSPARLQPGESCGTGGANALAYTLQLAIDSVTPTAYGRWAISYLNTIQTEDGSFVGTPAGNSVQLQFTLDSTETPCATPYVLTAALAGDTIDSAALAGGCIAPAGSLRLYPGDQPSFP